MRVTAKRKADAVAGLALLLTIAAASTADAIPTRTIVGNNIKHPDYTGTFASEAGGGEGKLQIKITDRDKQGQPRQGLFQPKRVPVRCIQDDQAYEAEFRLSPYVIYFRKHGRIFEGFDVSSQAGQQSILIFEGKLTKSGTRASGDIVVIDNPSRAEGLPYCSTQGKLPWSAKMSG